MTEIEFNQVNKQENIRLEDIEPYEWFVAKPYRTEILAQKLGFNQEPNVDMAVGNPLFNVAVGFEIASMEVSTFTLNGAVEVTPVKSINFEYSIDPSKAPNDVVVDRWFNGLCVDVSHLPRVNGKQHKQQLLILNSDDPKAKGVWNHSGSDLVAVKKLEINLNIV